MQDKESWNLYPAFFLNYFSLSFSMSTFLNVL